MRLIIKVLFATTNPTKVSYYASELQKHNIDIITLNDVDIDIKVEEDGKDSVENAIIKAKAYYNATKIPTIAIDDSLYIEGIEQEKQPGTHVRRVNGKRLSDEEMIEYYTNLVKENGGKLYAKWVKGIAICNEKDIKTYQYERDKFYFVDTPSKATHPGYPLDSIAIIPQFNKYLTELTSEEEKQYKRNQGKKEFVDFVINNI